jgi:hypothetical protein
MTDEPEPGVIGSLPRTRPHRRSSKRPAPTGAPPVAAQAQEPAVVKAATAPKARAKKPSAATRLPANPRTAKAKPAPVRPRTAKAKPAPVRPRTAKATPAPTKPRASTPAPTATPPSGSSPGVLETAVQAAAELTEIGLHAGARALRRVVSRLPRP